MTALEIKKIKITNTKLDEIGDIWRNIDLASRAGRAYGSQHADIPLLTESIRSCWREIQRLRTDLIASRANKNTHKTARYRHAHAARDFRKRAEDAEARVEELESSLRLTFKRADIAAEFKDAIIKAAHDYIAKAYFYNEVARKTNPDKYPWAWNEFQDARKTLREKLEAITAFNKRLRNDKSKTPDC